MNKLKSKRGFTLTELMVVCLGAAMVAVMLFSGVASVKRESARNSCVNNLKQVGVAFRVWEGDNNDKYPMAVSTASGGAKENVWSALNTSFEPQYGVTNVFTAMTNELSTTRQLACPADAGRTAIGYWTNANFQANISYFVGGDAADNYPQMILTGDRNIGTTIAPGVAATITNTSSSYANAALSMVPGKYPAWTATDLHQRAGNIGLADGSVEQVTISGLQVALQNTTNGGASSTPAYNFPN